MSYLFVAQGGRRFEGWCGPQAAERPGLGDFGGLQRPSAGHRGAEARHVALMHRRADHAHGLALRRLENRKPSDQTKKKRDESHRSVNGGGITQNLVSCESESEKISTTLTAHPAV